MSDKERLNSIKQHLAVLIRRDRCYVPFGQEYPNKWWFGKVIDPRTGVCFTPTGTWDFIAEQLEDPGIKIYELPLEKPPGRKAFVLKIPTQHGIIYVKIHFGGKGDTVIGRSFHYSEQK